VYLFGSVARGEAGPLSDVDLGLLFDPALSKESRWNAALALSGDLQRIDGPRIDVVILNEAPPALRDRVVREGRLLLDRDPPGRVEFEARALMEYLDFLPYIERFDRAILKRAREGRLGA
jgi:predicted nucleotidyltransferase